MKKLIAILTLLIFSCDNELEQDPGLPYRYTYREAFVNAPPIDARLLDSDIYSAVNGMIGSFIMLKSQMMNVNRL